MTKALEKMMYDEIRVNAGFVTAIVRGMWKESLGEMRDRMVDGVTKRYLRSRKGSPERYAGELREMEEIVDRWLAERYASQRRRYEIARVQRPLLRHKLEQGLGAKGICFLFKEDILDNSIWVQVVDDVFVTCLVDLENVDEVMGLMPYILSRPDRAGIDLRFAHVYRDPSLLRRWADELRNQN